MRSLAILLSLSLIAWTSQGIADIAVNRTDQHADVVPDTDEHEDIEINDAIEIAISNTDAERNKIFPGSASAVSQDVESSDQADVPKHTPVNGDFSTWHTGKCSKKCGGGVETITRACDNPFPAYGGTQCLGCLSKVKTCNTQRCPIDGHWTEWTKPKCSKSCGPGGSRRKTRTCTNPTPKYGGKKCVGKNYLVEACFGLARHCPIDGGWTDWKHDKCTKKCGGGKLTKTRSCTNPPPQYNGKKCIGDESFTRSCQTQHCPIVGAWSGWGEFGTCSKSCEGGLKRRQRYCNNPQPKYGGKVCTGNKKESEACNAHPCPKYACSKPVDFVILLDCLVRAGRWKREVKFVERMIDTIYRKFSNAQVSLIRYCTHANSIITFTDVHNYLKIKKAVSKLGAFNTNKFRGRRTDLALSSAYSMFTGNGRSAAFKSLLLLTSGRARNRKGQLLSYNRIKPKVVQLAKLRVFTTVVGFGFETLSNKRRGRDNVLKQVKKIASSKQHFFTRTYDELTSSSHHKNPVDGSFCPVNGAWTGWKLQPCSKSCGGGSRINTRTCTNPAPKSGGKGCSGDKTDILPCGSKPCPVDGHWSEWVETKCTVTCGGGTKSKSRSCIDQAYGGNPCKGESSERVECHPNSCPIKGAWTTWATSGCSKSCGGGERSKKRTCTNPKPQYGGANCAGLKEIIVACNQKDCPVNGNWGAWKEGACTKTCGGGTKQKTRLCNNPAPQNNGNVCPGEAMERHSCNVNKCPIDGVWSSWTDSVCSKACGGGRKIRSRSCTNPAPKYGGKQCSTQLAGDKKELPCNSQACPIDGSWGSWQEAPCTKTCGGGTKTKVRFCNAPKPKNNGKECGGLGKEELACNTDPCPVDGKWSPFGPFSGCSKSCAGGTKSRTRSCTNPPPAHSGKVCQGKAIEEQKCKIQPCPIDGNWSPWSETTCSKSCGGGQISKTRKCNNPPRQFGGKKCNGKDLEKLSCNTKKCPINGKWAAWTEAACSKTCGGGTKLRSRKCTNPPPTHGGKKCEGTGTEDRSCNIVHCPVDGNWSPWSDAKCSKKCDGGSLTRTRLCNNPSPAYHGKQCSGESTHTSLCNDRPCPKYICHKPLDLIIALDYSNSLNRNTWKKQVNFAKRIMTDGFREHPEVHVGILHFGTTAKVDMTLAGSGGSFSRIRNELNRLSGIFPKKGSEEWTRTDLALSAALSMFQKERRNKATKILAVLTDGYAVGPKLDSDGDLVGIKSVAEKTLLSYRSEMTRMDIHTLAVGFGLELIKNARHKAFAIRDLNAIATSKDMVFLRSYEELFQKRKIAKLTRSLCPVHGGFTAWKEGPCTKTCGGGTKTFTRTCTNPVPKYSGDPCVGKHSRSQSCHVQPCPVDGGWTPWVTSTCTVTCGGGTQSKTRSCTNPNPQHGGKKCPGADKEKLECNTKHCPIDGHWTSWSIASCTKKCGGGKSVMIRKCSNPPPQYGGNKCAGSEKQTKNCNETPCPIDGSWANWSPSSKCSRSCGGGRQVLERVCDSPSPQYGGKTCTGVNKKDVSCNDKLPCPVDGGWTQWADTKCSKTCGGGVKVRTRTCTQPKPAHQGKYCEGPVKKDIDCSTQECPINGQWSTWDIRPCSKTCGGGVMIKTRACENPAPKYGGNRCPGSTTIRKSCNNNACPIDGHWTAWIVGSCSRSCGGGFKKQTRTCSNPAPQHGGLDCAGLKEKNVQCNTKKCPVDGEWTQWSKFDKCTKSCGGGKKQRSRTCTNPEPAHGGKACEGELREIAECNIQLCQVCKQFKCTGCKCNGVLYKPDTPFITPDCKRKCTCSSNHVRCNTLCARKPPACLEKDRCYKKKLMGRTHGNKACYCFNSTCAAKTNCKKQGIIGGIRII